MDAFFVGFLLVGEDRLEGTDGLRYIKGKPIAGFVEQGSIEGGEMGENAPILFRRHTYNIIDMVRNVLIRL